MWRNFFLSDSARQVFETQLVSLRRKNLGFTASVELIESQAPPRLQERIARARRIAPDLMDGLIREALLSREIAHLFQDAAPAGVDAEKYIQRRIADEMESNRLDLQIRGQFGRVFLLFGVTTVYAVLLQRLVWVIYQPLLGEALETYGSSFPPKHWLASLLYFVALSVMSVFLFALGSVFFALKFDRGLESPRLRYLWRVPVIRTLFRKRITRRVLVQCSSLISSGASPTAAAETALAGYGLKGREENGSPLLPNSALLDPTTVEAMNLGSRLDTFEPQLANMLALLHQEVPYAAQRVTRIIYYVGYIFLGLMVAALLSQIYSPIFQMINPLN